MQVVIKVLFQSQEATTLIAYGNFSIDSVVSILLSWKLHLCMFLMPKLSVFEHWTQWTGGHLEFDLSEGKSNFPPHLKTNLMVFTNYARNFVL